MEMYTIKLTIATHNTTRALCTYVKLFLNQVALASWGQLVWGVASSVVLPSCTGPCLASSAPLQRPGSGENGSSRAVCYTRQC